jgi:transcriptional regulator with XRE-family HTH domain
MDPVHARLAERIRDLADDRGLALSVLADLAGVSRSQLTRVLACRTSPTIEFLSKVSAALGVDVSALLTPPSK